MPTIEQIVAFLDERESLWLGDSPSLPPPENDVDIYELDWKALTRPYDEQEDLGGAWAMGELADSLAPWIGRRPEPSEVSDAPIIESPVHVCAWYQPIHYHGYDHGIFIRRDCAVKWARWVARFLPISMHWTPPLIRQLICAGVYLLYLHEQYHHKVESLGLRLHVATDRSCYLPYQQNVYRPCIGNDEQIEEALANADAYLRLSEERYRKSLTPVLVDAARDYLAWSMPHAPAGYRQGTLYLDAQSFDAGADVLQERVRTASLAKAGDAWACAPQMTRSIFSVAQPVWWLVPRGHSPFVPVTATPVRTCSSGDLVKLCRKNGYQQVDGGKGSHIKMTRANSPMIIIPGDRKEVSPGVVRSALQALGDYGLRDLPALV